MPRRAAAPAPLDLAGCAMPWQQKKLRHHASQLSLLLF